MLTPQEAREQASFEKVMFGGYATKDVDKYVTTLLEDYAAMFKECSVLRSKLKIMVDRIELYRNKEDSMNKVLLAAQQSSDELLADTERRCAKMVSETEASLRQRSTDLQGELDGENARVEQARYTAASFIVRLEDEVQATLSALETLRQITSVPAVAAPEPEAAPAAEAAPAEMDDESLRSLMGILRGETAEPAPAAEPEISPELTQVFAPAEETVPQQTADEISRQIESSLSQILAEGDAVSGETKVIPQL